MEKNQKPRWTNKDVELEVMNQVWDGHNIRFIYVEGEWWAVLKDVADALNLEVKDISARLDIDMLLKVPVPTKPLFDLDSNEVKSRGRGQSKHKWMYVVSEYGIYEALFTSRKLEARKFRRWIYEVLQKLRKTLGLEGYEVFRMTEYIRNLNIDTETQQIKVSVTTPGVDVNNAPTRYTK